MRISSLLASSALVLAASVYAFDEVTMLCLVNEERDRYGLDSLGLDDRLNDSAYEHSNDQANMRSMTHDGSDGSSPGDRVQYAGYNWQGVAENVAYGYSDEEECMNNWMNSPGHRDNILGDYTHFGCGVGYTSRGVPYYTQDFASDGRRHNYPVCPGGRGYGGGGGRDDYDDRDRYDDADDWYGDDDDWYGGDDDWYDYDDDWYDDDWYDDDWYDDDWYDDDWYDDDWYDDDWYDDDWYDDDWW